MQRKVTDPMGGAAGAERSIRKEVRRLATMTLLVIASCAGLAGQTFSSSRSHAGAAAAEEAAKAATVDQATGAVGYAIPLASLAEGGITVSITAAYASQGLVVSDKGGRIGLGWNLDLGGSLTRQVRGIPDDCTEGRWTKPFSPVTQSDEDAAGKGERDSEYDIFRYNVAGYAGSFYVTTNNLVREIPETDCKIELIKLDAQTNAITTVGFRVLTPDGRTYTFGGIRGSGSSARLMASMTKSGVENSTPAYKWWLARWKKDLVGGEQFIDYYPSEYMLRSIEHFGGGKVEYDYEATHRKESSYPYRSYSTQIDNRDLDDFDKIIKKTLAPRYGFEEHRFELMAIRGLTGNQKLIIEYLDFQNILNQRLVSRIFSEPEVRTETIEFNYGSFTTSYAHHTNDPENPFGTVSGDGPYNTDTKPRLDAVVFAPDLERSSRYGFDYYPGDVAWPHPLSTTAGGGPFVAGRVIGVTLTDYAGFATTPNFHYGYSSLTVDGHTLQTRGREPSPDIAKVSMLRQVTTPAGGQIRFEYEGNERERYVATTATLSALCWTGGGQSTCSDVSSPAERVVSISDADLATASITFTVDISAENGPDAPGPPAPDDSDDFGLATLTIRHLTSGQRREVPISIGQDRLVTVRGLRGFLAENFSGIALASDYAFGLEILGESNSSTRQSEVSASVKIELPQTVGKEIVPGLRVSAVDYNNRGVVRRLEYDYTFTVVDREGASSGFTRGKPRFYRPLDDSQTLLLSENTASLPFTSGSITIYGEVTVREIGGQTTRSVFAPPQELVYEGAYAPELPAPVYTSGEGRLLSTAVFAAGETVAYATTNLKYEDVPATGSYPEASFFIGYDHRGWYAAKPYTHQRAPARRVTEVSHTLDSRTTTTSNSYAPYNLNSTQGQVGQGLVGALPTRVEVLYPDGTREYTGYRYTIDYHFDGAIKDALVARHVIALPYSSWFGRDGNNFGSESQTYGLFAPSGAPTPTPVENVRVLPREVAATAVPVGQDGATMQPFGGQTRVLKKVYAVFNDGSPQEWESAGSPLRTRLERHWFGALKREQLLIQGQVKATTDYTYYPDRRLETVTGPDGVTVRYTYRDASHSVRTVNECSGDATDTEFAPAGYVPDGFQMSRSSTRSGWSDDNWSDTWTTYDGFGRPVQVIKSGRSVENPDAGANGSGLVHARTEYDAFGRVSRTYAPLTRTGISRSAWQYGVYLLDVAPEARRTTSTYDGRGRLQTSTAPDGTISTYDYPQNSEPIVGVGPTGGSYAAGSLQRTRVKDAWGYRSETYADDFGRVIRTQNVASDGSTFNVVDRGYDFKGQLWRVRAGQGQGAVVEYRYGYDAWGQLTTKQLPNQTPYKYLYDQYGRLAAEQTPHTALAGDKHWAYTYDLYGNRVKEGLLAGVMTPRSDLAPEEMVGFTIYHYTQGDTKFLRPSSIRTRMLDGGQWVITMPHYGGPCGLVNIVERAGVPGADPSRNPKTVHLYDAQRRPYRTIHYHAFPTHDVRSTETEHYTADGAVDYVDLRLDVGPTHGQWAKKFDGTLLEVEYDRHGRLAYERHWRSHPNQGRPDRWYQEVNYGYDALGRLTSINEPLHREAEARALVAGAGAGAAFQGPLPIPETHGGSSMDQKDLYYQSIRYGNRTFGAAATSADHGALIQETVKAVLGRRPVLEAYGYDRQLRLERFEAWELEHSSATTVAGAVRHARATYAYDALSRPTSLTRVGMVQDGQAAAWRGIDQLDYWYDQGVGRTRVQLIEDAVLGERGHREDIDTNGYVYDAAGRVTYDPYKRLGYEYNALGLASKITRYSTGSMVIGTTQYRYSGDGTLRATIERNGAGAIVREVYHVDGHRYDAVADELYYAHAEGASLIDAQFNTKLIGYHRDHLGNVILAYSDLDNNGGIDPATEFLEEQQYWPYGMTREGYASHNRALPFGYNGAEREDQMGLHLTTYRTMAAETGLWGQTDPKAESDYAYSPYASMRGNPISFNDPDGDCPLCIAAVVGGLINLGDQALKGNITDWKAGVGYFATGAAAGMLASTGNVGAARAVTLAGNKTIQVVTGRLNGENFKSPQGVAMLGLDVVGDLTQVDLTRAVAKPLIQAWATRAAPAAVASVAGAGTAGSFNYASTAMDAVEWTGGNVVVRASASSSAAGAGLATKATVTALNPAIKITPKGLKHVMDRHTYNSLSKYARKSKFTNASEVQTLIQDATHHPMIQQANGNFARRVDAGRLIGVDRLTGQPTSIYSVITGPNGNLITSFPGVP